MGGAVDKGMDDNFPGIDCNLLDVLHESKSSLSHSLAKERRSLLKGYLGKRRNGHSACID